MRFRPTVLFPIAVVLSVGNLVSVWFAAAPGEPAHASIHAALAVACAIWAQRLRIRMREGGRLQDRMEELEAFRALETEVTMLREALAQAAPSAVGDLQGQGRTGRY